MAHIFAVSAATPLNQRKFLNIFFRVALGSKKVVIAVCKMEAGVSFRVKPRLDYFCFFLFFVVFIGVFFVFIRFYLILFVFICFFCFFLFLFVFLFIVVFIGVFFVSI